MARGRRLLAAIFGAALCRAAAAAAGGDVLTAADCTGGLPGTATAVASNATAGRVYVAGQDVIGRTLECVLVIGSLGAATSISSLRQGFDPGWAWWELYGAPPAEPPPQERAARIGAGPYWPRRRPSAACIAARPLTSERGLADGAGLDPGGLVLRTTGRESFTFDASIFLFDPPAAPLLSRSGFFTFHIVIGAHPSFIFGSFSPRARR